MEHLIKALVIELGIRYKFEWHVLIGIERVFLPCFGADDLLKM